MSEKKQRKIEDSFGKWLTSISISKTTQEQEKDFGLILSTKEGFFTLGWNSEFYEPILAVIAEIIPNVAKTTIKEQVYKSLREMFEINLKGLNLETGEFKNLSDILILTQISPKTHQLIEDLKALSQAYRILIPVEGIEMSLYSGELIIGDCTLYSHKYGPLTTELEPILSKESNTHIKKSFDEIGCYISVEETVGDDTFAIEQAIIKARDAIHMLNFSLATCKSRNSGYHKIMLVGESAYARDRILIYSSESQLGSRFQKLAIKSYKIDNAQLELWEKYEINKISEWFATVNMASDSIEAKIKRTIIWCSHAINADTKEIQFVSLTTALESLLLHKENEANNFDLNWGSISQRLADKVAYLLGKTYDERINFAKDTKRLYGLRSKVIHGGNLLSNPEALFELEDIVNATVIAFSKHQFSSWDKFMDWEKQQRYSLPSDSHD